MQPIPIVLAGDSAESTAGAQVEAAASVAAVSPEVRKNCRRFSVILRFMVVILSDFHCIGLGPDLLDRQRLAKMGNG
jgi:hypothetical protein